MERATGPTKSVTALVLEREYFCRKSVIFAFSYFNFRSRAGAQLLSELLRVPGLFNEAELTMLKIL